MTIVSPRLSERVRSWPRRLRLWRTKHLRMPNNVGDVIYEDRNSNALGCGYPFTNDQEVSRVTTAADGVGK